MGGNVKNAFTSEPKAERTCSECDQTFEDTLKYSAEKICPTCTKTRQTSKNLNSEITTEVNPETGELHIQISLVSTVDNTISIPVETNEDNRDEIIGLLRAESDNGDWYEDAWVAEDEIYGYKVRRGVDEITFTWPPKNEATGLRSEYQNVVGEPYESENLKITFTFIDPNIENISTTIDLPTYLINL